MTLPQACSIKNGFPSTVDESGNGSDSGSDGFLMFFHSMASFSSISFTFLYQYDWNFFC